MCCIGVRLLLISTTFWCMVVCVVKFYHTLNNDRKVGNLFLSKLSKTGKPPLYFIILLQIDIDNPIRFEFHEITF